MRVFVYVCVVVVVVDVGGAGRVLGETAATPGDTFTLHWHPVWVYFAGPAIMGMMMIMARFNRCASHLHMFISLPTLSS